MTSLSILIPAYNERATIEILLNRVLQSPLATDAEIIVVESQSTDGTHEWLREFAKHSNVQVVFEDRPQGKGHAIKTALAHAHGEVVLIQDADLEYDIADYEKLLAPIRGGQASFVLGSRHLGAMDWRYRRKDAGRWLGPFLDLGVYGFTFLFNALYGTRLTDPATMFKVFKRQCMDGITWQSNGFDLDWEIVAKFVRKGHVPAEVAVSYFPRSVKEGMKIS